MLVTPVVDFGSSFKYIDEINLKINGGTGYSWFLAEPPPKSVDLRFIGYQFAQSVPGASGAAVWHFEVRPEMLPAEIKFAFVKKRPWLNIPVVYKSYNCIFYGVILSCFSVSIKL